MTKLISTLALTIALCSCASLFPPKAEEPKALSECVAGPYDNGAGVHCKTGDFYYVTEGKCHSTDSGCKK